MSLSGCLSPSPASPWGLGTTRILFKLKTDRSYRRKTFRRLSCFHRLLCSFNILFINHVGHQMFYSFCKTFHRLSNSSTFCSLSILFINHFGHRQFCSFHQKISSTTVLISCFFHQLFFSSTIFFINYFFHQLFFTFISFSSTLLLTNFVHFIKKLFINYSVIIDFFINYFLY